MMELMKESANLIPWRPQSFDELIQEPFERIEQSLKANALERLSRCDDRLAHLEAELDHFLAVAQVSARSL